MIRINCGCGKNLKPGYVNIDLDTREEIKARYPTEELTPGVAVHQFDIFNLPYESKEVDEVNADSLLEHLSFIEEGKFFNEVKRVLKKGGLFNFSVPDFKNIVDTWMEARDEWKEFFRDDPKAIAAKHWFGQYSYSTESKWGYLTASLFGTQNGKGQFHKNCYTVAKIQAILKILNFKEIDIFNTMWKGDRDLMINVRAKKI